MEHSFLRQMYHKVRTHEKSRRVHDDDRKIRNGRREMPNISPSSESSSSEDFNYSNHKMISTSKPPSNIGDKTSQDGQSHSDFYTLDVISSMYKQELGRGKLTKLDCQLLAPKSPGISSFPPLPTHLSEPLPLLSETDAESASPASKHRELYPTSCLGGTASPDTFGAPSPLSASEHQSPLLPAERNAFSPDSADSAKKLFSAEPAKLFCESSDQESESESEIKDSPQGKSVDISRDETIGTSPFSSFGSRCRIGISQPHPGAGWNHSCLSQESDSLQLQSQGLAEGFAEDKPSRVKVAKDSSNDFLLPTTVIVSSLCQPLPDSVNEISGGNGTSFTPLSGLTPDINPRRYSELGTGMTGGGSAAIIAANPRRRLSSSSDQPPISVIQLRRDFDQCSTSSSKASKDQSVHRRHARKGARKEQQHCEILPPISDNIDRVIHKTVSEDMCSVMTSSLHSSCSSQRPMSARSYSAGNHPFFSSPSRGRSPRRNRSRRASFSSRSLKSDSASLFGTNASYSSEVTTTKRLDAGSVDNFPTRFRGDQIVGRWLLEEKNTEEDKFSCFKDGSEELSRVFLLLLEPELKKFELIQMYQPLKRCTIGDILDAISENSTEPLLGKKAYRGLCRPLDGVEMANRDDPAGCTRGGKCGSKAGWRIVEGEILIAIPAAGTHTGLDCMEMSHQILQNPKLIKLLQKANPLGPSRRRRRHGRGRTRAYKVCQSDDKENIPSNEQSPVDKRPVEMTTVGGHVDTVQEEQEEQEEADEEFHNAEACAKDAGIVAGADNDEVKLLSAEAIVAQVFAIIVDLLIPEETPTSGDKDCGLLSAATIVGTEDSSSNSCNLSDDALSLKSVGAFFTVLVVRKCFRPWYSEIKQSSPMGAKGIFMCIAILRSLVNFQKTVDPASIATRSSSRGRRKKTKSRPRTKISENIFAHPDQDYGYGGWRKAANL